jgi:Spy/CpxP family protein refolding chaperone
VQFFTLRALAVVVVSAMTLVATSGSAQAQGGGGRGMDGMMPQISSRNVDKFSKILTLTKDQKDTVDALLEGYAGQAAAAAKVMRDAGQKARDEFRDTQDPSVWEKMQSTMTKFRDERKKLDDGFMNDMKAILTPDQTAKWAAVERTYRRDSTLRWGRLSGERVDLVELTDQQKLAAEAMSPLTPILDQYQEELDQELVRRNEVYQGAMEKMAQMRRDGDMQKMQDVVEKGREAGRRVRDLNRRYFRQLFEAMPEGNRPGFEAAFNQESYPEVYRKGYATKVADAAVAMKDLTPEQKEQLASLAKRFEEALSPLQTKQVAATEEAENKFNIADMMARGWNQDGPVAELRDQRRTLEKKLIDDVKKVLTDDQQTRLPERSEEDNGGGRGGWGGGGGGGGRGGQNGQGGGRGNRGNNGPN